jgi:ERF superfamily
MPNDKLATARSEIARVQQTAFDRVLDAAKDQNVDVDKLAKLLDLGERMVSEQRKAAFTEDLTQLHADVGELRVTKDGHIVHERDGRVLRDTPYATLENIDRMTRPLLKAHGFSLSFDTKSQDGKGYLITGFLRHREGHVETSSILLPIDTGPGRNATQAVASTISYGRRHLYKMMLNIVEEGEDDDGAQQPHGYITQSQADTLRQCISEVYPHKDAEARFLKWIGAERFELVELRAWERARGAILKQARSLNDLIKAEAVLRALEGA